MAGDPFGRMDQRLLSRLGKEAFFRGQPDPIKVLIEHDVEIVDGNGELQGKYSMVSMPSSQAPRRGDSLVLGNDSFRIEKKLHDDGSMAECILAPA